MTMLALCGVVVLSLGFWLSPRTQAGPFSVRIVSTGLGVLPVGDPPREVVFEVSNRGPGPLSVVGFKQD